jgi:predicted nucleic acid-binding protein
MTGIDFIVDTNILIYIHEGKHEVEPFISYSLAVSFVTEIELLGFSKILPNEKLLLENLLADCTIIQSSPEINRIAADLKREYKLKTPDAIVAATAISMNKTLATADKAFKKIKQLSYIEVEL